MKKKHLVVLSMLLIFVISFSMEFQRDVRDWGLYVYICGDNNLDSFNQGGGVYGSFFQGNIDLLQTAKDDIHVVIFYDRWSGEFEYGTANSWWSEPVPRPEDKRGLVIYYVVENELIDITEYFGFETGQLVDGGSARNMEKFLVGASELFPARKVHIDIGSHGAGIDGVNTDYTSGTIMNLGNNEENSFSEVIGKVFGRLTGRILERNSNIKANVVAFDACLMGMSEINYELSRHGVEYVVSSQQVIPGAGFPYDKMVTGLRGRSPLHHTSKLVSDYVNLYHNSNGGQYGGFNLASIDTNKQNMDNYTNAIGDVFEKLVMGYDKLITSAQQNTIDEFHNIITTTFKYPDMNRGNFIDVIALLNGMKSSNRLNRLVGEDIINKAIEITKRSIAANEITFRSTAQFKKDTHGQSIYFKPYRRGDNYSNFEPHSYRNRLKGYSLSETKMYEYLAQWHEIYFLEMEKR